MVFTRPAPTLRALPCGVSSDALMKIKKKKRPFKADRILHRAEISAVSHEHFVHGSGSRARSQEPDFRQSLKCGLQTGPQTPGEADLRQGSFDRGRVSCEDCGQRTGPPSEAV